MIRCLQHAKDSDGCEDRLFHRVGITLWCHIKPSAALTISDYVRDRQKPILLKRHESNIIDLCVRRRQERYQALQLKFDYMANKKPGNVVYLAQCVDHRLCKGALDREVTGFLRPIAGLKNLCAQLYNKDIKYLGDLIAMSEEELLTYPGMNLHKLEAIKERLAIFEFSFGMTAPGWQRPSEYFGSLVIRS